MKPSVQNVWWSILLFKERSEYKYCLFVTIKYMCYNLKSFHVNDNQIKMLKLQLWCCFGSLFVEKLVFTDTSVWSVYAFIPICNSHSNQLRGVFLTFSLSVVLKNACWPNYINWRQMNSILSTPLISILPLSWSKLSDTPVEPHTYSCKWNLI